jgi:effector-binding domain-containing protein
MYEVTTRHIEEQPTLAMRARVKVDDMSAFLGRAFAEVAAVIQQTGLDYAGPPYGRYVPVDGFAEFDVEAGFPVFGTPSSAGDVVVSTLPDGDVAVVEHLGPYDAMVPAYKALTDWVEQHDSTVAGTPWEVYFSDPGEEPDPAKWRTEIFQPYRSRVAART